MYVRLVIGWLLSVLVAGAQLPAPSNVRDCQPCMFSPGDTFPAFGFTFDLKTTPEGRTITSIQVTSPPGGQAVQRLLVTGMTPVGPEEPFFFGGMDINFDGLLDLMLITRKGVANAYGEYWLFDPKARMFTALGTYPVFRVEPEKHRLLAYERGGSGGFIHQSQEYAFLEGKLTLVWDEKQEATTQPGVFRKVTRERIDGVMKTVKTESVRAPQ